MTAGLLELAIVVLIAAFLGILARTLRQPIILAYLVTGVIIGYFGLFNLRDQATFQIFADLGIMFLLFLVGLEINYTSLRLVGRSALIIGVSQVIFTTGIGFLIARLFDFSLLHSAYIALALTFSSTIIVVKLLSEKKDLSSLYGKIAVGVMLFQDFIAILILVTLAGIEAGRGFSWSSLAVALVKGLLLFIAMVWLGRKFLPHVFDKIARSPELLFLTTLAWVFLLAALAAEIGFSIEIAGFLAGLALANSAEHFQIANRVRPLRDFFILIFFVILGSSIVLQDWSGITKPILAFSAFVIIGNPLIVLLIMSALGYRKRTSFLTGVTVGQISEFSLILVALGLRVGHLNSSIVSLVTAVGVITIIISAYIITHGDKIFRFLARPLSLLERKQTKEVSSLIGEFKKSFILIGAHRTGQAIALSLPAKDLLVIEFDPEVIHMLKRHNLDYIFGDIADPEVFAKANFETAKLVISTNPDLNDNLGLLTELKKLAKRPKIIVRADDEKEAEILYKTGVDYVLLPNFTAGQYLAKTIAVDPEMQILEQLRKKDLEMLRAH